MEIGIIGSGDMGKLYAGEFAKAGYHVNVCDLPEKRSRLEEEFHGSGIHVLPDGIAVSRSSDLIIYAVEAENIVDAVRYYGPSTKKGAVVAGQTSVKTPEIEAFEKYLPADVNIVTCHSLHGPTVSPKGQSLVVINHRSTAGVYKRVMEVYATLGADIVEISSYQEHDKITADTQAVTHFGFESMATAWRNAGYFPWEDAAFTGGIDNIKVLMAFRILYGKSHLYAGLAILNPFAKIQIRQYARSVAELFKMMVQEDKKAFEERIKKAGDFIFKAQPAPLILRDELMGEYALGNLSNKVHPNSHLSLLAMVDAWYQLGVNPYNNLICQTPPFRLRLGIVEYLFRNTELLHDSIRAALTDKSIQGNDLDFHSSVREWGSIIEHGDIVGYKQKFDDAKAYFSGRLAEAQEKSSGLIKRLMTNPSNKINSK